MVITKANRLTYEESLIRQMSAFEREGTIHLGIGQLKFPAPRALIESGKRSLDELLVYPPNQGIAGLRDLVALDQSKRDGKPHSAQEVVITNGAEEALFATFGAFINPEDEVLIPEIAFGVYEKITAFFGGVPRQFKLDSTHGIDYESLRNKLSDRTKFLVLNSPSNPTGRIISLQEGTRVANLLSSRKNVYVVSDEIYSDLYFGEKPLSFPRVYDQTIVISGLSKRSAAAGMRLGWAISPDKETSQAINQTHSLATSCASIISQRAAIPILKGEGINEENEYRDVLRRNAALCANTFSDLGIPFTRPDGSFYFFPNVSRYGIDSLTLAKNIAASETNVITVPGVAFGKAGDKYLRLSCAVGEATLVEGLNRLSKFFRSL